jgi:hypothetical protein
VIRADCRSRNFPDISLKALQPFERVSILDFIRFFSSCTPCRPQRHSQRQYVLGDAPSSRNICREKPMFAGKVTCGARNETSGQSWPSSTVATDPFTGQNRNSNVADVSSTNVWAVSDQRLCTFRFKRFVEHWDAARGVSSSLPFSPITVDKGPLQLRWTWGWRVCEQLPDCRLANLDQWTGEIALPRELGALDGPVLSDVSFERQL